MNAQFKDKIGTIITNYGNELETVLGIRGARLKDSCDKNGYVFTGVIGGTEVTVTAEPTDETGDALRVTDIRVHDGGEMRKLHITYKMIKGKTVAETYIAVPISQARYEELAKGVTTGNKAWEEITQVLKRLTRLQGYSRLGAWSADLEVKR
jgi:hypothetical protein